MQPKQDVALSNRHAGSPRLRSRHLVLPALLLGLVTSCAESCCETEVLIPKDGGINIPVCALDKECGAANEAYRFGACGLSGCDEDEGLLCCPGTRCRRDVNACVPLQLDPEYACEDDGDCPDPAMRCQEVTLGGRPALLACAYDRCQGDADCGIGRSCYHQVCVQTAPCGGACPEGSACDVLTSQCAPIPAEGAAPSCAQTCGEAGMLVFSDPDTMSGEVCCYLECQCKGLPPLLSTRYGRYARVAVSSSEVLVSAYDSDFGDLVVAHYKSDGTFSSVEFVDGMPLSGDVVADPNGPRGGIAEPGPNVGTHTSIAVDDSGRPRVAYYDVDNKSLKVAVFTDAGWTTQTVDSPGGDGSVGTFTDIEVEPSSGRIHITYLAHDVSGAPGIGGPASGVKLARSRTPSPAAPSDWEVRWVDARPTFDPCNGACTAGQQCVLGSAGAACFDEATGCTPACSTAARCVNDGAGLACLATAFPPSMSDFPKARGLHTSVALDGPETLVAYYDSIDGDVRFARVDAAGAVTTAVVDGDGNDGRRGGDIGRFPALVKAGDDVVVLYGDFTRHELRAWRGATPGTGGAFTTVDLGKESGDPGKRFVGAGARVALDANASPLVVYQDASNLDLKMAREASGTWQPERVIEQGPHGFYSDVAVSGAQAFLVSVIAELDSRGRERSRVGLTVRNLP